MAQILRVLKASGVQYHGRFNGYLSTFECDDDMAKKLIDKVRWCELVGPADNHLMHANEPLAPKQIAEESQTILAAERVAKAERHAESQMKGRKMASEKAKKGTPQTPAELAKSVRDMAREAHTNRDAQMAKVHDKLNAAKNNRAPGKGKNDISALGLMNPHPSELDGPRQKSDAELTAIAAANTKKAEEMARRQVEANRKRAEKQSAAGNKGGEIASLKTTIEG